jgi:hypothetical protein
MMRPARRLRPVPAAGRIDKASSASEPQFRQLLEALPAAVYSIDAEDALRLIRRSKYSQEPPIFFHILVHRFPASNVFAESRRATR